MVTRTHGISTTALLGKIIDFDKYHACPNKFTLALFNKRKLFTSLPPKKKKIVMPVIFKELNRMYNRQ